MNWALIGSVLIVVGVFLVYMGIFRYKEGSQRWIVANADLVIIGPGFILYITGLCMVFSQA